MTGRTLRRFKLTVATEELKFNNPVLVDTIFLTRRTMIHMVYVSTHLFAARFLQRQSTKDIWNVIRELWLLTYLGPPDFISVDHGSAYTSDDIRSNVTRQGRPLEVAPIETPG